MSWPKAVMVDYLGEPVKDVELSGKRKLVWQFTPAKDLDVERPHRRDIVDRVFEIDGRAADGETWIYRETHAAVEWCDCVHGWERRR